MSYKFLGILSVISVCVGLYLITFSPAGYSNSYLQLPLICIAISAISGIGYWYFNKRNKGLTAGSSFVLLTKNIFIVAVVLIIILIIARIYFHYFPLNYWVG